MNYPKVKQAHIVPRVYLRAFAEDDRLAVHVDGSSDELLQHVDNVATRRRYYRRTRPRDGSEIDDIEWSLSEIERRAAPVLETILDEWPLLDLEQKAPVAQLIAAQFVRVPSWMAWREQATRDFFDTYRGTSDAAGANPGELAEAEQLLLTDTQRLTQMLEMAHKLMPTLASMHWTLVEFRRPLLATSDQPVVMWPLGLRAQRPGPTPPNVGVMATLETRIPISPQHLLLMTWADHPDDVHTRRRGARHHAKSANAFTIANADRQWFHRPGLKPPRGVGSLLPISPEILPGYSHQAAASSRRRQGAQAIADSMIGRPLLRGDQEVEIVTVR